MEKFECIFGALPATPTMTNAECWVGLDEVIEGLVFVFVSSVEDVREAEEEGWDQDVAAWNYEPEPL